MRTTAKMGEWRRKDRQSTAEKILQKSALTPWELWPRYRTSGLGQTLFACNYECYIIQLGVLDWSVKWAQNLFKDILKLSSNGWLKLTVAIICKYVLAQANPVYIYSNQKKKKRNYAVMSFFWHTFSVLSRSADVQIFFVLLTDLGMWSRQRKRRKNINLPK